jgi:hypothetical protein
MHIAIVHRDLRTVTRGGIRTDYVGRDLRGAYEYARTHLGQPPTASSPGG